MNGGCQDVRMARSRKSVSLLWRGFAGVALLLLTACASPPAADGTKASSSVAAIRAVVDKYVQSIDDADTTLAREVWADSDGISFIHPLGHERGWIEIKSNLYEKIMRDLLSSRKLNVQDVTVKLFGDAAVVEFYWVFDAKWRKDGSALRTQGRETQVLRKGARGKWELVHVHYSGMPGPPAGSSSCLPADTASAETAPPLPARPACCPSSVAPSYTRSAPARAARSRRRSCPG